MSSLWAYWTFVVAWSETTNSTKRHPDYDWCVWLSDSQLTGWDEILNHISENGWEIVSVVGVDEIRTGSAMNVSGGTNSFRFFVKKPAIG
jgi:hypothetical protein